MSNIVDIIGVKSVTLLISQSGLTKFIIRKFGDPVGSLPVFESLDNKTSQNAVKNFDSWAQIVLLGNPKNTTIYDLQLFNEANFDPDNDDDDSKPMKIGRAKRDKIRVNFQLTSKADLLNACNDQAQPINNVGSSFTLDDVNKAAAAAINDYLNKEKEDKLLQRIGDLENKLEEALNNDYEDEDEDEDQMIDKVERLFDKINLVAMNTRKAVNNNVGATMNGNAVDRKALLNETIKELIKVDPKLPEHLFKLLQVAKEDPKQFDNFIKILDSL